MTEQEIQDLIAERNSLRAKVQLAERVEAIFSDSPELTFDDYLELFPEQVRELQAEAGRAGYYEGFKAGLVIEPPALPPSYATCAIDHFKCMVDRAAKMNADQYAATVRKGGE